MKNTSQKLILISFMLALIAAIVVFVYLQSLKSPKEVLKKTSILVAVENIPARTMIDKKMVKEIEVTDNTIFSDYIKDSSKIVGKYTKETILKNEGFLKEKLLSEGGDELSLKIDKDNRAISINVTGDGGVADLIKPADFVDIIVYLSEKKDGQTIVRPDLSKIILQNIEILAVDAQLNREEPSKDKTKENEKAPTTFLVTLSVPNKDVEKLVLAESIGSLKLVLRPLKADGINDTKGATAEELTVDVDTDKKESNIETKPSEENKPISNADNSAKYTNYTVKRGDTLRNISRNFYGDPLKYTLIKEANNIGSGNIILPGEILKIPEK